MINMLSAPKTEPVYLYTTCPGYSTLPARGFTIRKLHPGQVAHRIDFVIKFSNIYPSNKSRV